MKPEVKHPESITHSSLYPDQPIDSTKTNPEKRKIKKTVIVLAAIIIAIGAAVWIYAFMLTDYGP